MLFTPSQRVALPGVNPGYSMSTSCCCACCSHPASELRCRVLTRATVCLRHAAAHAFHTQPASCVAACYPGLQHVYLRLLRLLFTHSKRPALQAVTRGYSLN